MRTLRLATRGSPLAIWQAQHAAQRLVAPTELVIVETSGDKRTDIPIWQLGERGVFSKEVQYSLLEGDADVAVHSAKDLPSSTSIDGLTLVGMLERGDARDVLVGSTLEGLPHGATVATGSARRQVQMQSMRPDVLFTNLRGNIGTRLQKLDDSTEISAIVMAAVALERLGWTNRIDHMFDVDQMLPQVGQGALAVECRTDDAETIQALQAVCHATSTTCVMAERAFLAELGGACDLPVGAYAELANDVITITGLVATVDGVLHRHHESGTVAAEVGASVARHLLNVIGGRDALDEAKSAFK